MTLADFRVRDDSHCHEFVEATPKRRPSHREPEIISVLKIWEGKQSSDDALVYVCAGCLDRPMISSNANLNDHPCVGE